MGAKSKTFTAFQILFALLFVSRSVEAIDCKRKLLLLGGAAATSAVLYFSYPAFIKDNSKVEPQSNEMKAYVDPAKINKSLFEGKNTVDLNFQDEKGNYPQVSFFDSTPLHRMLSQIANSLHPALAKTSKNSKTKITVEIEKILLTKNSEAPRKVDIFIQGMGKTIQLDSTLDLAKLEAGEKETAWIELIQQNSQGSVKVTGPFSVQFVKERGVFLVHELDFQILIAVGPVSAPPERVQVKNLIGKIVR